MCEVLRRVEGQILLIWDKASWHRAKAVEAFVGKRGRLQVVPLPKRAPQDDPIEEGWRVLKNEVERSRREPRAEPGCAEAACRRFFEGLTPKQAFKTAGLR